jgi:hypothetical protein
MILFINKVKIKREQNNCIERQIKKNMNLNSKQINWWTMKLRKQFNKKKNKKQIDMSMLELVYRWILKNIFFEETEHDNFYFLSNL